MTEVAIPAAPARAGEIHTPTASSRAALFGALSKAQALCRKAELDGRFEGGKVKYPFTSANERMAVARDALGAVGLALVRVGLPRLAQAGQTSREIVNRETGEVTQETTTLLLMEQDFLLTHESGAALETGFRWPVIAQEPFRPFDKAWAGADTSGLSYLIRDVLLMPSAEPEDEKERSGSPNAKIVSMPSRPPAPATPSPTPAAAVPVPAPTPAPPSSPALAMPAEGPDVFDQAIASDGVVSAHFAAEQAGKAKLAAAPLAAAKLYALQPEVQDRALYLEVFAVAEKRFGSRERAIAAIKELGLPQGTVPTVGQLRQLVQEKMP